MLIPIRSRSSAPSGSADDFDARHSATRPPLSLPHRQPPRAAHARARPRLAREAAPRRGGDARGGARARRPARLHHLPRRAVPGEVADPHPRQARRRARRRRDSRSRSSARSFLHRQVRSMVGSLVEVGAGRWTAGDLAAALDAADRSRCGQVAPAVRALSGARRLFRQFKRNKARARAHRSATALRDRRARPARRRREWLR